MKRMHISPADATQSTTPLDVLLARETISPEAHAAAAYFIGLRRKIFGKAHPGAIDLTAVSRGGMPEETDTTKAEIRYRDACAAVKRFGGRTFNATEDLLVHERWPEWIKLPNSAHWERRLVLLGISALLGWYRGEKRGA
jgi:hypothetical protein